MALQGNTNKMHHNKKSKSQIYNRELYLGQELRLEVHLICISLNIQMRPYHLRNKSLG